MPIFPQCFENPRRLTSGNTIRYTSPILKGSLLLPSRPCASRAKAEEQTRENVGPLPIFENRASLGFNENFYRICFSACMRIKALHGDAAGRVTGVQ